MLVGIALAVLASILWAIGPLLYKTGATESVLDDLFSIAVAALISAFPLAAFGLKLSPDVWAYGFLFSLLGPVLGTYVYLLSLRYAEVGLANLASYAYIVIVPLLEAPAGGLSPRYLAAGAVSMAGLYAIMKARRGSARGLVLALLSALFYALSFLALGAATSSTDPWSFAFTRAVSLFSIAAALEAVRRRRPKLSGRIFLAGILSYGVGGPVFILSVYMAGVVVPTIITALSPALTEILAAFRLNEKLDALSKLGFLLVMAGIIVASV
ncbi:MAG: DMT family transporter [Pyrobaculum sp.]